MFYRTINMNCIACSQVQGPHYIMAADTNSHCKCTTEWHKKANFSTLVCIFV